MAILFALLFGRLLPLSKRESKAIPPKGHVTVFGSHYPTAPWPLIMDHWPGLSRMYAQHGLGLPCLWVMLHQSKSEPLPVLFWVKKRAYSYLCRTYDCDVSLIKWMINDCIRLSIYLYQCVPFILFYFLSILWVVKDLRNWNKEISIKS